MRTDPDSLKPIANLLKEHEAVLLVNFLGSLGIKAEMFGTNSSSSWPELPENVSVVVRQADLARAQQAMTDFRRKRPAS